MAQYDYDMITIGAGSGGVRASRLAGGYGARSAVVEEDRVGGTCVLRGCIPKKLMIYGAHYHEYFEDAKNYGWDVSGVSFDMARLIDNKNTELDRLNGIYLRILRDNKVDLLEDRGLVLRVTDAAGASWSIRIRSRLPARLLPPRTSWSRSAAGRRCPISRALNMSSIQIKPWSSSICRNAW